MKQGLKLILFVYLRGVIRGPFLLIGFLDSDSLGYGLSLTVVRVFAPDGVLNSEDVLTGSLPGFKVGAGALASRRHQQRTYLCQLAKGRAIYFLRELA